AFSPKHYPKDIINFANTRGRNKIMYAGYFPMGLTLEKIFTEMQDVPLKEEVLPLFLGQNAKTLLKL
ncbi:MAG: amidohydrolase, partial [Proteobacteria bacterium]|nr:amidohydrolase [Pseudomonadota bacterium]